MTIASLDFGRVDLAAREAAGVRGRIRASRAQFAAVCLYFASQAYAIPLMAAGPSWATWPTLSDVAFVLLMITTVWSPRVGMALTAPSRRLCNGLCLLWLGCVTSYLMVTLLTNPDSRGVYGVYGLYRFGQSIAAFVLIARVPLTDRRRELLHRVVTVALLVACASVGFTYFEIVKAADLVSHLPSDLDTAGPWGFYSLVERRGWGTLGYNHSFVALQIIVLLAVWLQLSSRSRTLATALVTILAIAAVFFSESRTGLATVLIFSGLVIVRRRAYLVALLAGAIVWFSVGPQPEQRVGTEVLATLARQTTLARAFDRENLSSRPEIWANRFAFLNERPLRWVIGAGFGSAPETGENAHMQYLHTVIETGLVGLLAFALVMQSLVRDLYRHTPKPGTMLWLTVALLISAAVQETLYPVAAGGSFLGFYLASIGLALQPAAPDVPRRTGPAMRRARPQLRPSLLLARP